MPSYRSTLAPIIVFAVVVGLVSFRTSPIVSPDEIGPIAIAQFLAGKPFIQMGAAPFYSSLAGVLYAPIIGLVEDPWLAYRGMMLLNAGILALCVPLLISIAREVTGRDHWILPVAAAIVVLWPSHTVPAGYTWPEALFRTLFLLGILAGLRTAATGRLGWAMALAISAVLLYETHPRALLIIPLTFVFLGTLCFAKLLSKKDAAISTTLLVSLLVGAGALDNVLIDSVWEGGAATGRGYLVTAVQAALTQPMRGLLALDVLIGQTWYQISSSLGLVVIGIWFLLKTGYLTRDKRQRLGIAFALLSVGGVFAASVGQMIGANRLDHVLYGRYADGATMLLFWFGMVAIIVGLTKTERVWIASAVALMALLTGFAFLQSGLLAELQAAHPNNVAGLAAFFWHPNTVWQVVGPSVAIALAAAAILVIVRAPLALVTMLFVAMTAEHILLTPKLVAQSATVENLLRADASKIATGKATFWTPADRNVLWLYQLQFVAGRPFETLTLGSPIPPDGVLVTNAPYVAPSVCEMLVRRELRLVSPC